MSAEKAYLASLKKLLARPKTDPDLFKAIVNAPFHTQIDATMLDLGILVLLLVGKPNQTIDRIALSDTHAARGAVNISDKPFEEIKIPVDHTANSIAKAISSGEHQIVVDWKFLFTPDLPASSARFNQAAAGIECSVVQPLPGCRDGGALIFSYYQPVSNISSEHFAFMDAYRTLVCDALNR